MMGFTLADARRTDRHAPEPLEATFQHAKCRHGHGSQGRKDAGRQTEIPFHRGKRLDQRAAIAVTDESQQAGAVDMTVRVGHAVEEAEEALVRERLHRTKGRPAAQSAASRSRAPWGRNFSSASLRMSK